MWWLAPGLALTLAASSSGRPASAQEAPASPQRALAFGATLEGYVQWNANDPADRAVALRAYDTRSHMFAIQQVAGVMELAPDPASGRRHGLRIDLQFGQATAAVQGSAANEPRPEIYRHIWQAYGSYVAPVGRGLRVDFGKFASNIGYETNYARDNQAFSRALLFNFLPFYHMGLRASIAVNDTVSLMATLTNGVQQTEEFNSFKSGQLSATVTPVTGVSWTVNYFVGREQPDGGQPDGPGGAYRVFDTYVSWAVTTRVSLGADLNHTSNEVLVSDPATSVDGIGAYLRAQVTPATAIAIRYERLDDEGVFSGTEQLLQELTLTAERRLAEGLIVRAEYRHDWSDERYFASDRGQTARQPTVLVGAIWSVGTKSGAW